MKKTFRTNLGSVEAKALGLNHKDCQAGDVADLTDEQVKALADKHPAIFLEPEEEAALKAVAKPAAITAPATPTSFADNSHDTKKPR